MRYPISIAAFATLAGGAALLGRISAANETMPAYSLGDTADQAPGPTGKNDSAAPDISLGDLNGPTNWGGLGGIGAYSLGVTWCNIGGAPLSWVHPTNQHQVGAGAIYRLSTMDGAVRFEQLGMSWCKHGFCALQGTLCGACATPACGGCCSSLAAGCSNPYTASGLGQQSLMGPRYQINASTGFFNYPFDSSAAASTVIHRRIQVANADLDPALNPGAIYFGEGITVHPQDAQAGNAANNASHRRLLVGAFVGTVWQMSSTGTTTRLLPAVHAWKTAHPSVTIANLDVPSDGRFVVAYDVTDLGGGQWHYEYAIYNISSHRSGQSFSVPVAEGATLSNIDFHGPLYHSGDKPDNVPWSATVADGHITWSTQEDTGPAPGGNDWSAYALRFGTLYNFRFDADVPPRLMTATLGLFRPGAPNSIAFNVDAPVVLPPCAVDFDRSGAVDGLDLAALLAAWGPCPGKGPCSADLNADELVNGLDLAILLAAWGPC